MQICKNDLCTGCGACVQACPMQCISMGVSFEGYQYPVIDASKCAHCNKCVKTCHVNKEWNKHKESVFFMGWHRSMEILRNSSSGGAFTALADLVFDENGVVFGACFDNDTWEVRHIAIERKEDLPKIRLSKYYQGRMDNVYVLAKQYLVQNRVVLFSGTSCQIAGLYSFLGKDYQNLLTTDILCHGIASKKVVDAYIKNKEKKYKKKIVDFRFRLKPDDSDWMSGGGTRMRLNFTDGSHVIEHKDLDTYFVGFNQYLFLRKSCYQCKYAGGDRIADFTLADYWGVPDDRITNVQKQYGVSLILVNSEKARTLVSEISKEMVLEETNPAIAISHNQALVKPSTPHPHREKFFSEIDTFDFDKLVHKYNRKYYVKFYIKLVLTKLLGEDNYMHIWTKMKSVIRADR